MRKILFTLFCFFVTIKIGFALEDMRIIPIQYAVSSDKMDESIPKGQFIIEGTTQMFSSLGTLKDVLVGCTSSGTWTRSNDKGEFQLTLPVSDSVVYFYLEGWSEVVIEDYDFKDQHRVKLTVYLNQEREPTPMKKPVIYLYADTDLTASVKINPMGNMTFTYPSYEAGWEVAVGPNTPLQVNGKQYPYLFWEAESTELNYAINGNQLPGFVVESKNVVSFFEEKLTEIGFNDQERTDFITYWAPQLSNKAYAFVQFVIDDQYESKIASLDISPKPDAIKRVYILCSGLDDPNMGMEVVPQELKAFDRSGFTVLEWGGSLLDMYNLAP